MPTLKAPRKTVSVPAKKAVAKKPTPKVDPDKIAKAKAAAAAKKNGAAKPSTPAKPATAASKTAAAVKKAAASKKPRTAPRAKASAPASTSTPQKLNLFTTAEVAAMNLDAKRGMAAFLEVPANVYSKLSEADLDSLLLGTHDYWFKD